MKVHLANCSGWFTSLQIYLLCTHREEGFSRLSLGPQENSVLVIVHPSAAPIRVLNIEDYGIYGCPLALSYSYVRSLGPQHIAT